MAADHPENLDRLFENVSDDVQNLNSTLFSLQSKLVNQLKEVVGPQVITIRKEVAAYEREKAEIEGVVTRIQTRAEGMKNVMKQFKEEIATSQLEDLVVLEKYLRQDFEAELNDDLNGVNSIIEQPRGDGSDKDLMMKLIAMCSEDQRNQDELNEAVKKLKIRKEWAENTMKQLQELETMTEWVENACISGNVFYPAKSLIESSRSLSC